MHRGLTLALVSWASMTVSETVTWHGETYEKEDDMLFPADPHPADRNAATNSATSFSSPHPSKPWRWPLGQIRYYFASSSIVTHKVDRAIAEIERTTCLSFTKCYFESTCETPYVRITDEADGCFAFVGSKGPTTYTPINLGESCGEGQAMHEILHAVGLKHEHSRRDRDRFVKIDSSAMASEHRRQFEINPLTSRDIGAYDYDSVMHYATDTFARDTSPTIVAPVVIGQRNHISAGDAASIDFLYNSCEAAYTVPTCAFDAASDRTLVVPHSKSTTISVHFQYAHNVDYALENSGMRIANARLREGTLWGVDGTEVAGTFDVSMVPDRADAGSTFRIGVRLQKRGDPTINVVCALEVQVAHGSAVCFGVGANDDEVCSGRGTCKDNFVFRVPECDCREGFGGPDCSGLQGCPANSYVSFDTDGGSGRAFTFEISDRRAAGAGSLRLGSNWGGAGYWKLPLAPGLANFVTGAEETSARRYTFYASGTTAYYTSSTNPSLFRLDDAEGNTCLEVVFREWRQRLELEIGGKIIDRWFPQDGLSFAHIDLRVRWEAKLYDVYIDGRFAAGDVALLNTQGGGCKGAAALFVRGHLWIDELRQWCHSYIVATGSLLAVSDAEEVRKGSNLELVLTIVGGDSWRDTRTTRKNIIRSLTSSLSEKEGWNANRHCFMDEDDVVINDATATITLSSCKLYQSYRNEPIAFLPQASMFASSRVPEVGAATVLFTLPGDCPVEIDQDFDGEDRKNDVGAAFACSSGASVRPHGGDTDEGVGAVEIKSTDGSEYCDMSAGGNIRPRKISFAVLVAEGNTVSLHVGPISVAYTGAGETGYQAIMMRFDWEQQTYSLFLNGKSHTANVELTATSFKVLRFSGNGCIDSVRVSCPELPPLPTPAPDTPAPPVAVVTDGASMWCLSDVDCRIHGDPLATCVVNACDCSVGYSAPAGRVATCVEKGESTVRVVVAFVFPDAACETFDAQQLRALEGAVKSALGGETSLSHSCGSVSVFGTAVADAEKVDTFVSGALSFARVLSESVAELSLGNLTEARLLSGRECETADAQESVSDHLKRCQAVTCNSDCDRELSDGVFVCDCASSSSKKGLIIGLTCGSVLLVVCCCAWYWKSSSKEEENAGNKESSVRPNEPIALPDTEAVPVAEPVREPIAAPAPAIAAPAPVVAAPAPAPAIAAPAVAAPAPAIARPYSGARELPPEVQRLQPAAYNLD
eukprot:Rhum_TRINITY_DN23013_c0_g1::Rhum_TRINITY_DN23013_c0_g1_i1::g.176941::m.176941